MKDIKDICFIVQARLNSERVPQKMIKPFAGTTLTDIVLEKLVKSKIIPNDQIYLAAHEEELIRIGEQYPINIYQRSHESANVDNGIQTLFEWWNKLPYTYVVMVSGCNPMLKLETIEDFVELYTDPYAPKGMFSVILKQNYFWSMKQKLLNTWPKGQDLLNTKAVECTLEAAHCIYASEMKLIGEGKWCGDWERPSPHLGFYPVDEHETFDIDEQWQFNVAEKIYKEGIY